MPEELRQRLSGYWLLDTGYYLKDELESDLKLSLLVAARRLELIAGRRQSGRRYAERAGGHGRGDAGDLLGVEDVLDLGDHFRRHVALDADLARVAEVEVLARRQRQRVARHADRTVA